MEATPAAIVPRHDACRPVLFRKPTPPAVRFWLYLLLIAALTTLFVFISEKTASAWPWDDAVNEISRVIKWFGIDCINWAYTKIAEFIKYICGDGDTSSVLTGTWGHLFSQNASDAVATWANKICKNAVKPIAWTLVSLVVLIQLIKVAGRMEANGTIPALKEMFIFVVIVAFFIYMINHAEELCAGVYNLFNTISTTIVGYDPSYSDNFGSINFGGFTGPEDEGLDDVSYGSIIGVFLGALVAFLVTCVAYVISLLMCYARGIQLYFMMTFSPVAFAFLGADETRPWGIGFIKSFCAVCLAGAIMVFVLMSFPYLCTSVLSGTFSVFGTEVSRDVLGNLETVIAFLKVVVISLLLCYALIKSGAWARDLLGG